MNNLQLILPNTNYKIQYLDMIKECKDDILKTNFEIYIPTSTETTFEDDIDKLIEMHKGNNLPNEWVPVTTFWLIDQSINHNFTIYNYT